MGYTHYWRRYGDFTDSQWAEILKETKRIVASYGEILAGWDGTGEPVVDENAIRFNGKEPDSCETFSIRRWLKDYGKEFNYGTAARDGFFDFCKTRRCAYDGAVVEVLALIKRVAPEIVRISSDGGPEVFPGHTTASPR